MCRITRFCSISARPVPAQFARFERLLEVVGNEHEELAAGRERYRFYRDRGYALNNYKQGGVTEHSARDAVALCIGRDINSETE